MLAISHIDLLPSAQSKASAFLPHSGIYPNDHNYIFFGVQYRACTLVPSRFVLPLTGLHVDSQGFGLTLAREFTCQDRLYP